MGMKTLNHVYHWPLLRLQETVLNFSYCKACSPTEVCTCWCSGSTTSMQHQPLCSGCLWMEDPCKGMLYFSILNRCGHCIKSSDVRFSKYSLFLLKFNFLAILFLIFIYFFKKLILWGPYILDTANMVSICNVIFIANFVFLDDLHCRTRNSTVP